MSPKGLQTRVWERSYREGWRSGLFKGAAVACTVFIINLALAIVTSAKSTHLSNGRRILYEGSCSKVKQLDTGIHLLINVLSTLLLSACNYAMQCLSAPTRDEVDEAHKQRVWLDIGILSSRNLGRIAARRRNLWIWFAISSLPLHLFYNSSVYASIYTADYLIVMVTEDLLASNAPSSSLGINSNDTWYYNYTLPGPTSFYGDAGILIDIRNDTLGALSSNLYASAVAGNLTRLNASECITSYATTFPTEQGSVLLVTKNATQTPYVTAYDTISPLNDVYGGCPPTAFDWICNQVKEPGQCGTNPPCSKMLTEIDANNWRPFGNKIDYCLSQRIEEKCNLALNEPVIGVVLMFNLVKCFLLVYTIVRVKETPLLTVGDSIASFLQKEDATTKQLCLMDRYDLQDWQHTAQGAIPEPKAPLMPRRRWNSVVGAPRWACLILLYLILLTICTALFIYGIEPREVPTSTLMGLPIGATDPNTMIEGNYWNVPALGISALLSNIFIANSPQLILSMIYVTYNSLFTSFLLGAEWNSFGRERNGLRMSGKPVGDQKGTHFLQLPFRWAVPLMILSIVLHWLCSQSIFLVSTEFDHSLFLQWENPPSCDSPDANIEATWGLCLVQYFTCGYSPVAILSTIVLGFSMIGFALLIGMRKFKTGGMPVVGSCSAAISASCHLSREVEQVRVKDDIIAEEEISVRASHSKLQWGEFDARLISDIDVDQEGASNGVESAAQRQVYHCGFSHQEVKVPEVGKVYAG